MARRNMLHAPDIFRFQRVQRHGHRTGAYVRLYLQGKLRFPVRVNEHDGILAALAHLAFDLVQGVFIYPARREPPRPLAHRTEPPYRVLLHGYMARRELDFRGLGSVPRRADQP